MLWTLAMGMQVAGPPDLAPRRPARAAPSNARYDEVPGDEIVVCGRRDAERFRLRPLPQGFERDPRLPRAGMTVGGVGVSAEVEAGQAAAVVPRRAR